MCPFFASIRMETTLNPLGHHQEPVPETPRHSSQETQTHVKESVLNVYLSGEGVRGPRSLRNLLVKSWGVDH